MHAFCVNFGGRLRDILDRIHLIFLLHDFYPDMFFLKQHLGTMKGLGTLKEVYSFITLPLEAGCCSPGELSGYGRGLTIFSETIPIPRNFKRRENAKYIEAQTRLLVMN